MDILGESASLAANAKTLLLGVRKRTDIWDSTAENSVRIPYLPISVSRIRQALLSNHPGIYSQAKTCRQAASAPKNQNPHPPPVCWQQVADSPMKLERRMTTNTEVT
jgi:hypothetical protein